MVSSSLATGLSRLALSRPGRSCVRSLGQWLVCTRRGGVGSRAMPRSRRVLRPGVRAARNPRRAPWPRNRVLARGAARRADHARARGRPFIGGAKMVRTIGHRPIPELILFRSDQLSESLPSRLFPCRTDYTQSTVHIHTRKCSRKKEKKIMINPF